MKQPSILIILLLIAIFGAFYGMAQLHTVDEVAFAGPVRVPVYVSSEQTAVEPTGTMIPLRQSPLMQVQAPSVQTADQLTSGSTTGWNLTATSDAHTSSVGGGMSASSEGNMFAASSYLATPAVGNCATALPAITPNRQRTVSALAMTNTNNLVTRRRAAQSAEPTPPSFDGTYIGETHQDEAGNVWQWLGYWELQQKADPVDPDKPATPLGDAPWWIIAGGLLLYAGYKRKLQTTQN